MKLKGMFLVVSVEGDLVGKVVLPPIGCTLNFSATKLKELEAVNTYTSDSTDMVIVQTW